MRMVKIKHHPISNDQQEIAEGRSLTLFNDDVNSFDFVITTLMEVCDHEPDQAEQCALIAHYKGKCIVKLGSFHLLKPMFDELIIRGLTVVID